ncbi:hypothetical protein DFH07DRAFT_827686 [Mycena maculata]|uniref:F-box domain-containing protein n=1 Tax=Mycena maculata TaxID=230809 RepID=A0AAD7N7S5_9AGAR|nr:hypothetical protein DFH07DRAFT_827686 [Mycena maculata]
MAPKFNCADVLVHALFRHVLSEIAHCSFCSNFCHKTNCFEHLFISYSVHPLCTMPQEIIDMVIDNVADSPSHSFKDKRTLAACALVCRSWLPRTRHHLFDDITLNRSIASFAALLRSEHCTFAPYVRNISAFRTFMDPSDHHFDKIGKDLKRLTNVRTLMLDGMFHACAPWTDFMCGFKHVTELYLHFHLTGNSNCVLGMIHMLPALRRLEANPISPVVFWNSLRPPPPFIDIAPPHLTPPPHLHSIRTGGDSARHILTWLEWFDRLSQIDHLELSPIPGEDKESVLELLRRMGSSLQSLDVRSESVFRDVFRHPSLLELLNVSMCKKLETLRVPNLNSNAQDVDAYETLRKFILGISAPTLESVIIEYPGERHKLMDWAAVDAFLAFPDFPRLRTVQISVGSQLGGYFEENLPRLHELGLLKVETVRYY